jgi:alanyl-tRNA synthetase
MQDGFAGGNEADLTGNEIREKFLQFFEGKGHRRVRSSSLVPHGDATLLFTNAGMNQFKDVFLGLEKRDYTRATTAQKCVRAGGKHNDLENVGFTKRHHTFFEMMGNFSFGDYFKKEAIAYAWELITSPQWFGIDKNKLYVTVFGGAELIPLVDLPEDSEARGFWLAQNVSGDRIFAIPGLKENFWAMGDIGPCGPCSEIHYDMGPDASEQGHTNCEFPCDCGRYVEIWNLVFMQFNRDADGKVAPLPKPCVDTGMGLERVAAVLQGVISNYDTDLFKPLMLQTRARISEYKEFVDSPQNEASLRIIADHGRATTFLIADEVMPSNEGRGYVLRKIMRRALRHVRLLGGNLYTLSNLTQNVADLMGEGYPELRERIPAIRKIVRAEEERFERTIDVGLKKLDLSLRLIPGMTYVDELVRLKKIEQPEADSERYNLENILLTDDRQQQLFAASVIVGDEYASELIKRVKTPLVSGLSLRGSEAFRLYETYGLPRDFVEDAVRDQGLIFDSDGFDHTLRAEQTRARASWKGGAKEAANPAYAKLAETF